MQLEPAAWRALHVDFHDFGHPVILGMAGPHLGRHVHEARHHVGRVEGRLDRSVRKQRHTSLHHSHGNLELELGLLGSCGTHMGKLSVMEVCAGLCAVGGVHGCESGVWA